MPDQDRINIHQLGAFDGEDLLAELRELRERLIAAWRERAVMLTREEQDRLLEEIKDSCALLTDLTK